MDLLPSNPDLPSFLWGAIFGGVAAFATGFLSEAGKRAFESLSRRISPPPPDPKQVPRKYLPDGLSADRISEIREDKIVDFEHEGYRLVLEHGTRRPLFRLSNDPAGPIRMFLMHKPDGSR